MADPVLDDNPAGAGIVRIPVRRVHGCTVAPEADALAVEEPLEIRLGFASGGKRMLRAVSVTMRTPGHDRELAAGFLWTEGIIDAVQQIQQIRTCGRPAAHGQPNTIRVDLRDDVPVNWQRLERHFSTTSSCGVCGKTSLEAVRVFAQHSAQVSAQLEEASLRLARQKGREIRYLRRQCPSRLAPPDRPHPLRSGRTASFGRSACWPHSSTGCAEDDGTR